MKTPLVSACIWLVLASSAVSAQNAPPLQRAMIPKPLSARPAGLSSVSTAESGGMHGHEPLRRLPSFQTTRIDGTSSDITAFKQTKHWLLLYRRESCAPCDRMLSALAGSDASALKTGLPLVIVVADRGSNSNGNRLDALRARFANMTGATWLEDNRSAARQALKPRGTPMLYALSGERIEWSAPGLPDDQGTLEKRAAAWLNSEDPQKSQPLQAASAFKSPQP